MSSVADPRAGAGFSGAVRDAVYLGAREIRTSLRTPAFLLPNLLMPVFFFFFMTGSLGGFAAQSGLANFSAFALPMSVLFAVTGGSAGLNMVADIESGYFDKLLLTPANRFSILVGAMSADLCRIMTQGLVISLVAVATGTVFATGLVGLLAMLGIASLWGLGYSAIGFSLALKTGNPQVVASMWAFQVPFVFLTTAFAPKEALSGWLQTAATYNPMTYVLAGLRSLSLEGGSTFDIVRSLGVATLFCTITVSVALLAMRGRVR